MHPWSNAAAVASDPDGFLDRITMMGMCLDLVRAARAAARRAPAAHDGHHAAGEPMRRRLAARLGVERDPRGRRRGAAGGAADQGTSYLQGLWRTPGSPPSWSTRATRSRRSPRPTAGRRRAAGASRGPHRALDRPAEARGGELRRARGRVRRPRRSGRRTSDAVAFKSIIAYRTGLDVRPWSRSDANAAFTRWREDGWAESREHAKPVRDNLLRRTFEVAAAAGGPPVHIHCGGGDPSIVLGHARPQDLFPLLSERLHQPAVLITRASRGSRRARTWRRSCPTCTSRCRSRCRGRRWPSTRSSRRCSASPRRQGALRLRRGDRARGAVAVGARRPRGAGAGAGTAVERRWLDADEAARSAPACSAATPRGCTGSPDGDPGRDPGAAPLGCDVSLVALHFSDMAGMSRTKIVPLARLERVAIAGVGMAEIWAISGNDDHYADMPHYNTPSGDMRLVPDLTAACTLPPPGWAWAPVNQYSQELAAAGHLPARRPAAGGRRCGRRSSQGHVRARVHAADRRPPGHPGPGYSRGPSLAIGTSCWSRRGNGGAGHRRRPAAPEYSPGQFEISRRRRPRRRRRPARAHAHDRAPGRQAPRLPGLVRARGAAGRRRQRLPSPPQRLARRREPDDRRARSGRDAGRGRELRGGHAGGAAGDHGRGCAERRVVPAPAARPLGRRLHRVGRREPRGDAAADPRVAPVRGQAANVELKTVDGAANPYLAAGGHRHRPGRDRARGDPAAADAGGSPACSTPRRWSRAASGACPRTWARRPRRSPGSTILRDGLGTVLHDVIAGVRREEWAGHGSKWEEELGWGCAGWRVDAVRRERLPFLWPELPSPRPVRGGAGGRLRHRRAALAARPEPRRRRGGGGRRGARPCA